MLWFSVCKSQTYWVAVEGFRLHGGPKRTSMITFCRGGRTIIVIMVVDTAPETTHFRLVGLQPQRPKMAALKNHVFFYARSCSSVTDCVTATMYLQPEGASKIPESPTGARGGTLGPAPESVLRHVI